ncbi:porin [Echinimonas agarilytica]|uniref:Porin n=1 Tax=Echinimonas agarilytica TaxID=1215918 RepID=A0AA42B7T9_9GAMM|nr:porin [Echinimonas agarilytica]MCM2680182.1 porin [Echinimonas agarilytica]
MNLVKSSLALALAAAACFSIPALAVDPVTLYGKVNLSAQSSDDGDGSTSELKSNASRIGVKGGLELNESLKVIYTMEFQVNIDDESSDDTFSSRNQWVGLEGDFGQVLMGRNDSLLKQSQGKVDLFNDLDGDIKTLFAGENRINQTVTYKSPKYNGFQFGATWALEGAKGQNDNSGEEKNGFSTAVSYGDSGLKKSPIYAAVAYDKDVFGKSKVNASGLYDIIRGTVQGKVGDFVLGAIVQSEELSDGGDSNLGYMGSVAYKMDAWTFKAQYQTVEAGDEDPSAISVGVDYKLAKPTKVYAFYTTRDEVAEDDQNYFGLGIEHKF